MLTCVSLAWEDCTSAPLSSTLAELRLTPKSVASEPGATPATNEAAFTRPEITGTALPAFSVRVTAGAASSKKLSCLTLPAPGGYWKRACPDASAVAMPGVTPPPAATARIRAPGYGNPLVSLTRTTTGAGKGPADVETWLSPETAPSVDRKSVG